MSQIARDIIHIARCGTQYRGDLLAPLGLKSCHASYLIEIAGCPGISQDQLSRRICINKSNVARQLAVLEEAGFVTRIPCPRDKRILQLYPTEKTRALLPEILSAASQWEQLLTQEITPEETALLANLLAKMKIQATNWMEGR